MWHSWEMGSWHVNILIPFVHEEKKRSPTSKMCTWHPYVFKGLVEHKYKNIRVQNYILCHKFAMVYLDAWQCCTWRFTNRRFLGKILVFPLNNRIYEYLITSLQPCQAWQNPESYTIWEIRTTTKALKYDRYAGLITARQRKRKH